MRWTVAAVWIYEGVWCKLLGREAHQLKVVTAVPKLGPVVGPAFLFVLGAVELGLGGWVLTGMLPGLCAAVQAILLLTLNANGLLWARRVIHDPAGMVVKNIAFLTLVWMTGASR
jgi:hypothetical protein